MTRQAHVRIASVALFLSCVAAPMARGADEPGRDAVSNSVVKVFATLRLPDPFKPWTRQAPSDVTGSGVVIEGKRILTNAHVVLYAGQVQVLANQSADKLTATVESIAPGIDLAVLKLDDESFFATHPPLARATTLPEIKDAVMAYGYPTGGDSLSITKGIVSRIEFTNYTQWVSGLRVQIDAAINPGNSGGPAIVGDRMIGLAFSRLGGGTENIGYIIPCEEIELFLKDVADGRYDGKPALYDGLQTLENDSLRAYLRLGKSAEGIVVHDISGGVPDYPLKEWDLITRIGDTPVDDQGMIQIGPNLRVKLQYLVQKVARGGKIPLRIVREGKEIDVQVPVATRRPSLVPDLEGAYPSYFVYGPLVFSTATAQYVAGARNSGLSSNEMMRFFTSPWLRRMLDRPAFDGEAIVIVSSPFFPHRLSKGYSNPVTQMVTSVNGTKIRNLAHLVEVLRDAKDEFITLEFEGQMSEAIVLPRADASAATEEILTDNGVRSQGSADTMAVWGGGKGK
ncbi:MAG: trypsin-like peptidase domain-containing protein [Acidobacteria bacterium]|nr:trypsin-like peptidase domain-containing protein [Acidobacteriota bacterium]